MLVSVDVAGLSYKEASKALGVPEGTVMSRLYRARKRVVEAYGPLEGDLAHALPAGELGELLVRHALAGEDAGVAVALPRRGRAAVGRAEDLDRRALDLDRARVVRRVERVAADDRVGERLAVVVLVVDGRRRRGRRPRRCGCRSPPSRTSRPTRGRRRRPARRRAACRPPRARARSRAARRTRRPRRASARSGSASTTASSTAAASAPAVATENQRRRGARTASRSRGRPPGARAARAARAPRPPRRGSASARGAARRAPPPARGPLGHRLELLPGAHAAACRQQRPRDPPSGDRRRARRGSSRDDPCTT